jgi:seryl-tRNA synthetase
MGVLRKGSVKKMTDKIYELDKQLIELNTLKQDLQQSIKDIEMSVQMEVAMNKDLKNADMRNAETAKLLKEIPVYNDAVAELNEIMTSIALDTAERDFEMREYKTKIAEMYLEASHKQYDAALITNGKVRFE